jgi:uncharacterized SAM-binding protein YcdF (DUF218 family)
MHRLLRSRVLLAVLAALLVLAAVGGWLLVRPINEAPASADVVLVLAGGSSERETTAARLAREGAAPVLLFSDGGRADSWSARLCRQRFDVRVLCLHPEVDSTRGEAGAFAELAGREGWRSVTVVTSSYHRRRAGLLVGRCFPGRVQTVGAPVRGLRGLELARVAAREGAALLAALTLQRRC